VKVVTTLNLVWAAAVPTNSPSAVTPATIATTARLTRSDMSCLSSAGGTLLLPATPYDILQLQAIRNWLDM
jgi:hypothetical protein